MSQILAPLGTRNVINPKRSLRLFLAALVGVSVSCSASWAPTQRFGEAPGHLTPEAKAYRQQLLEQVLEDNKCPEGFAPMEGHWRVIVPQAAQAPRNEIYFRNQKFTEFIAVEDNAKKEYAIQRGWYACVGRNKIVLFIESVEPEGAFGNASGHSYPCQVYWNPMTKRDTFALLCSFEWNPAESTGYSFQRVGY